MPRKRIKLPLSRIKKDYSKGMTLRELEEKYNVSRQTILRRFYEEGFATRKLTYQYENAGQLDNDNEK